MCTVGHGYFKKELPSWVANFNDKKNATTYTKTWDLLLSKDKYKAVDESPYEVVLAGKSAATFPYNFIQNPNIVNLNFLGSLGLSLQRIQLDTYPKDTNFASVYNL